MNMFKKNGGFTLVELIVVIAILAILAGVAVPMYSGYITKANQASDMTLLDSVKTAAVFAVTEKDPSASVKTITVTEGTKASEVVTAVAYKVEVVTFDNVTYSTAADATNKIDLTSYVADVEFKSGTTATLDLTAETTKWVIK